MRFAPFSEKRFSLKAITAAHTGIPHAVRGTYPMRRARCPCVDNMDAAKFIAWPIRLPHPDTHAHRKQQAPNIRICSVPTYSGIDSELNFLMKSSRI